MLRRPFLCIPGVLLYFSVSLSSDWNTYLVVLSTLQPRGSRKESTTVLALPSSTGIAPAYTGSRARAFRSCSSRTRCWRSMFCSDVGRKPKPARLICTSYRNSSMREWRRCTFLHSVRRSMSLPRNNQIISASRLKPLSGYSTHVRGEARSWRSCRWSRPWLGDVRINW